MREERRAAFSSCLVHPAPILISLAGCVCAALYEYTVLAAFLGFIFALTSCSLLWGRMALRRVDYAARVRQPGVFPGQEVVITRTIRNRKMIPLIWLELLEPCRLDGCAVPAEDCIVRNPFEPSEEMADPWEKHRCIHTFSLLKWHQTISFSDNWKAMHRGIQRICQVTLRSGDGFGLSVAALHQQLEKPLRMVVYPARVEVSVDKILNDMWESRSSSHGYLEDRTLIRGVRDYQPTDSARHINQRLLARGQGLKVNQYEVVSPDSVLFAFDAASFNEGDPEELEEALSIVASLITGLCRRGLHIGLAAPASPFFPATLTEPSGEAELGRLLELLAGLGKQSTPLPRSLLCPFPESLGQTYYVARSADEASSLPFLAQFPFHKAQLLAYDDRISGSREDLRVRPLKSFRSAL